MAVLAAVQLLHTQTPTQQPSLPSVEEGIQETELCEQIKGQNCRSARFSRSHLCRLKVFAVERVSAVRLAVDDRIHHRNVCKYSAFIFILLR